MKPVEILNQMGQDGLEKVAHVVIEGKHEYYFSTDQVKALPEDSEVKVLSWGVQGLSQKTVLGNKRGPPRNGKKRLYNVRT